MSRRRYPPRPRGPARAPLSEHALAVLRSDLPDAAAGRELELSRQRVRQLRDRLAVPPPPRFARIDVYEADRDALEARARSEGVPTADLVARLVACLD